MGEEQALNKKKLKTKLSKRAGLKKQKVKKKENNEEKISKLIEIEEKPYKLKEERKKVKYSEKKRGTSKNKKNFEHEHANHLNSEEKSNEAALEKKRRKPIRIKKTKNEEIIAADSDEVTKLSDEMKDGFDEQNFSDEVREKKRSKLRQKKRKHEKTNNEGITESDGDEVGRLSDEVKDGIDEQNFPVEVGERKRNELRQKKRKHVKTKKVELDNDGEDGSNQQNDEGKMEALQFGTQEQFERTDGQHEADTKTNLKTRKSKKARRVNKEDLLLSQNGGSLEKTKEEQDEVYEMSSGDEDCSQGMKKWIMEYHQSRPGIEILQERIDDFIIAHEAQQEQERKEREALAAEGGWTVVTHHKGRKKTIDSESGVAVGSVAPAAVTDKMTKKKNKEVGLDFYRFQKREAQRSEIMMLQSKFEQDKKRIQQMRAARKFRPY